MARTGNKHRQHPQVIVGVARSASGIAALRTAAAEAVRRGAPLYAARVQPTIFGPVDNYTEIDEALADAFGSLPAGLEVHREVLAPPVAEALTGRAHHPGDLLILGAGGGREPLRRRRFWGRSVVRACLRTARCPVVIVSGAAPQAERFPRPRTG